jgi:hypothetical protein
MKFKKIKLCAILILATGLAELKAQEAIPATGGNASGTGGSATYTVGQVVYTYDSGFSGSVAQGVQQPYEISVVSGLEDGKDISLKCNVYPNPATDFLVLSVESDPQSKYIASLFDINDKLLRNYQIESNETKIDLRNFATAVYFLKIVRTTKSTSVKEITTFKIIKN